MITISLLRAKKIDFIILFTIIYASLSRFEKYKPAISFACAHTYLRDISLEARGNDSTMTAVTSGIDAWRAAQNS